MGNFSSTTAERIDPSHIFTSPDQVRNQLLQTLYCFDDPRLEAFRSLFYSKALKDDEIDRAYWKMETFVDYLVEINPDVESATRNAGTLLYNMMLRYGSFPFPVDEGKRMTCEVFISGIAMQSRLGYSVLWRNCGFSLSDEEPARRERSPADDVRLFFQSIAKGNLPHRLYRPDKRSSDDDEDLLDVLVVVMRSISQRRNAKIGYRRNDVFQAAAALPSSFSRDLQGLVSLKDLRLLVELATALATRFWGATLLSTSAATDCLIDGFSCHLNGNTGVDWGTFHDVVLWSFPKLLAILSAFIDSTFQITRYFWLEPELLPRSPRIHEVISQSKIVSPEQLVQLLLVIPGGLALHFKEIVLQERLAADHAGRIVTLLQNPGRLFIVKSSKLRQETSNQDFTVMCVYTGTPGAFRDHLFAPGAWSDNCIVFSLYPAHIVYHPTHQYDMDSNLEIHEELSGLLLGVQSLKISFTNGLCVLNVNTGLSTFESDIEALEIWTV